jgi:3-hydroxyacyl-CoA dehydrogenase
MSIEIDRHDVVMVISVDHPPVNALSAMVRQGLDAAIEEGELDPNIKALVILCAGRTFFSGADIAEFGKASVNPRLPALCDRIERSTKPVIAAIHGSALGGGLEVALACHYRIATDTATFAMPEVKLGLLPGAGGTQRLPRLIGVAPSLEMIVLGQAITAPAARAIGLVDRLAPVDALAAEAIAFARTVARSRPLPRACERAVAADLNAFARFEQQHGRKLVGHDAPTACLEAVRLATTSLFEDGARREGELFERLKQGKQSKALRYLFVAERKAPKLEGLDAHPRSLETIAVVGAGTMGAGITLACLSAGFPVTLLDATQRALDRGLHSIDTAMASAVAKGRLTPEQAEAQQARLSYAVDYEALSQSDLIIEAAFEVLSVKTGIFGRLDRIAKPGAILATNTSYLDIDEIAASTGRPEAVLGLHFFSPANIMRLLEVVRGKATAPDVVASALAFGRRVGKIPVVSGLCQGFIGNRILAERRAQAFELLLEGATPQAIDEAHIAFGMPMGPFQMSDLAGVDIGWHRDPTRIGSIRDALCARGGSDKRRGGAIMTMTWTEKSFPPPRSRRS